MSCWVALVDALPPDAWASAELPGAGHLVVWQAEEAPVEGALRADPRAFDPAGEAAWVSWVHPPEAHRILFDDPAVQQARRVVLAGPPPLACTTLVRDGSHFAGSLTAYDRPERLADDPFARLWPPLTGPVGPGLVARALPPTGPVLERYAGAPWPMDRF